MNAVLIVTNEQDLAVDLVVLALERRGVDVLRCNTERLPAWQLTVAPGEAWELKDPLGRTASAETTRSVWWRRPEPPACPTGQVSASQREAFAAQWQAALEALASVPGPRWISPPAAIRAAEDKAAQLVAAARLGFRVPTTVWSNQARAARRVAHDGRLVAKPVTAAAWEDEHGPAFVFADLVSDDDLPADALSLAPMAFQRPVWPKRDVRVTVVGGRVLAAVAGRGDGDELDWRLHPDRSWSPHTLEAADADRCARLVAELGLRFGGIDLAVDGEGDVSFLEINPNGEWGWLAQRAQLPIVEALADDLTLDDVQRT